MVMIATPALTGDIGGNQVFSANCAACHAGGMNVIMKDALTQYLAVGAEGE